MTEEVSTTHITKKGQEEETETITAPVPRQVSTSTPIALAIVIALVSMTATGAWKMSAISTKLDNITLKIDAAALSGSSLERDVGEHKRDDAKMWQQIEGRVTSLERGGSEKAKELEKRVNDLEIKLKVSEGLQNRGAK